MEHVAVLDSSPDLIWDLINLAKAVVLTRSTWLTHFCRERFKVSGPVFTLTIWSCCFLSLGCEAKTARITGMGILPGADNLSNPFICFIQYWEKHGPSSSTGIASWVLEFNAQSSLMYRDSNPWERMATKRLWPSRRDWNRERVCISASKSLRSVR